VGGEYRRHGKRSKTSLNTTSLINERGLNWWGAGSGKKNQGTSAGRWRSTFGRRNNQRVDGRAGRKPANLLYLTLLGGTDIREHHPKSVLSGTRVRGAGHSAKVHEKLAPPKKKKKIEEEGGKNG